MLVSLYKVSGLDMGEGWTVVKVLGNLFLLFFFLFSFLLWIKLGLFLLFPLAFVFLPFITHIYFSLF